MARKVIIYCGDSTMDFSLIQKTVEFITRYSWDSELSDYYHLDKNIFPRVQALKIIHKEWHLNRWNIRPRLIQTTRSFQSSNPKDKVYALIGLFNDFIHRRACHLYLYEKSHQTDSQLQNKHPGIKIYIGDEKTTGLNRVVSALKKLIIHQAETKIRRNEQRAIRILRKSGDHRISAIHINLVKYLRFSLINVIREQRSQQFK